MTPMTPEREKLIRDLWKRERTQLWPMLRQRGFVNAAPRGLASVSPVGTTAGDIVEVFQFSLSPLRRSSPSFVMCCGLQLEEVPRGI